MELLENSLVTLSDILWGWPMIVLLIGTHLFLTIRLRFPQLHIFTAIRLSLQKEKGVEGAISPFGALTTSLAATVGTGNIIGVATAVALGGPGAVLWCWLTGILGISTKYAEALLSIKYRVVKPGGEVAGGPMYVLERGLNMRWAGVLFAIFTAVTAFGIGNTVQSNAIALLVNETWGVSQHLTGGVIAFLAGLVLIFGLKGIARVCTMFVPLMALLYVSGCLLILWLNRDYLSETISLIFTSAFTPRAAGGGFVGTTVLMAARFGIARGLFSNESGMGSAPIIAAAAKSRNPVRQALVSSSGTFWDTVVICALTGLMLVSCIIAYPDIDHTHGGTLTKAAFGKIPYIGSWILSLGILTFAFTTILGWSYYGEKAVEYLGGRRWIRSYRILWVIAIYVGAIINLAVVWSLADCMNALMAIPNLISLLLLSRVIVKETRKYLWAGKLDELGD